tara:strand:+ start:3643 stop:6627 length:2985 start_codon:yes stop_codon:yes gene_type:complete
MIHELNEQASGPISFEEAMSLVKPGDTFNLFFKKEVSQYGFTIFKPGKFYEGTTVTPNGDFSIKHEDIMFRGDTSVLTKNEFLEKLKEEGEPCDILDCYRSVFIRPGVGQKTLAAALEDPSFAADVKTDLPTTKADQQPLAKDEKKVEEPTAVGVVEVPEGVNIHSKPATPNLKIEKNTQGQYFISYGPDPLGGASTFSKRPVESELQRLFGYNTWEEYKKDNFNDLTKVVKKDNAGNIISAPTVHPFHVAYALEEFSRNFDPGEYELVGVPKGPGGNTKPNKRSLITLVSNLRRGMFGSIAAGEDLARVGIINAAMYNPREGLTNKEIIDQAKKRSGVSNKVKNIFASSMFVRHPNGSFWRSDFKDPFTTSERSMALIVNPTEVLQDLSVLNEGIGRSKYVLVENQLQTLYEINLWRMMTDPRYRAARSRAKRVANIRWNNLSATQKMAHVGGKFLGVFPKLARGGIGPLTAITGAWMLGDWAIEKFGGSVWEWGKEAFGWDDEDEEIAEKIDSDLKNLSKDELNSLITSLPAQTADADIASIENLQFYLLPKNWSRGGILTKAEEVFAKRIGANFSSGLMVSAGGQSSLLDFNKAFAKKANIQKPAAKPTVQKVPGLSVQPGNILVFGHSQAAKYGKSLSSLAGSSGSKITKIVKSGHSDGHPRKGLDKVLDQIPNKNYTHALLFLGGNTKAEGPDYPEAKQNIINFVTNTLKVPINNILVILPPVNMDNNYSKSRLSLNKRAEQIFASMGVKVYPQVVGNSSDFQKDGYHISSGGKLTIGASKEMLNSFSVSIPSQIATPTKEKPPKYDVARIVADEARKANVDPIFALTVARIESNFNPLANSDKKSTFKGLYQFGSQYKDEWSNRYGLNWEKVYDARESAAAFMNVIKQKIKVLKSKGLIKNSTAAKVDRDESYLIYLSWQQGNSGIQQIVKAAKTNTNVPSRIQANMDNNTYPKTNNIAPRAFLQMWYNKMLGFQNGIVNKYTNTLLT